MFQLVDDGTYGLVNVQTALETVGLRSRFVGFKPEVAGKSDHLRISSFLTTGDRTIHVVADQPAPEQRLAIARELGRWVLHRERLDDPRYRAVSMRIGWDADADQREAEIFACELLAPEAHIRRWRRSIPITYASLGQIFGLPAQTMRTRLAA